MEFELKEEEEAFRRIARQFAVDEVLPQAAEIDRKGKIPRDISQRMAELKLFGIPFPKKYGGADATMMSYVLVSEELSSASASIGFLSAAGLISSFPIYYAGSEEQKEKYLKPLCSGEKSGAFALTEPSAGSDPASIETTAVKRGGEYVLNGRKALITNAAVADIYVVLAYTDKSKKKGENGMSAFIIEKGTEGFSFANFEDIMGMRGCVVGGLEFKDCRIPEENRLGGEGEGFKIAMATLDMDRIGISSIGVGITQACLDASKKYANERVQFSQPIVNFPPVQFMLADMAVELETARLLTYKAAYLADKGKGERITKEASMAKLYASEVALRAATNAVQIHGGYGCTKRCPAERYFRDAKILSIVVGTSEIQRMIIARELRREAR
uniref:Crotonobetainyl-CoA reductase n=1 Tax=Candidatus Methanophagaceae archaeon ANME-1 ERB6 TaxID=2759912 RepID=A0A7G9Z1B2_9EURY|nr:crotonobetainyl-CoA reductase [Methanosarcinales archaeon ANME-1 ERB6]